VPITRQRNRPKTEGRHHFFCVEKERTDIPFTSELIYHAGRKKGIRNDDNEEEKCLDTFSRFPWVICSQACFVCAEVVGFL